MSVFDIQIVAGNPDMGQTKASPLVALVDTGSELTWLPAAVLREIGVIPRRKRVVLDAAKQRVQREVGHVILYSHGRKTEDEVVFAEPGDRVVVGRRTLEGFGVTMDDRKHRFVSIMSLKPLWQGDLPKAA